MDELKDYEPKESDRVSVWRELNKGIVLSTEPLRLEEINELITYEN